MGYDLEGKTPVQWPLPKDLLKNLQRLKAQSNHTRMPDFVVEILEAYVSQSEEGLSMPSAVSQSDFIALQMRVQHLENTLIDAEWAGSAVMTVDEKPEAEPENPHKKFVESLDISEVISDEPAEETHLRYLPHQRC